jgi:hypothetical protein
VLTTLIFMLAIHRGVGGVSATERAVLARAESRV